MDEQIEKAYSSKEVSLTLNVGDSTLRKWALALEKNGYGFIRNDLNRRSYVEGDLVILRHFQNLVQEHNMQLDNSAKIVISRFGKGAFEVRTDIVLADNEQEQHPITRSNNDIITTLQEHIRMQEEINQELIERLDQQEQFNRELLNRLDQQQDYLKERFERMERDQELTASLRESLRETQKQYQLQIAAAHEEEKKKGFWSRLFTK